VDEIVAFSWLGEGLSASRSAASRLKSNYIAKGGPSEKRFAGQLTADSRSMEPYPATI
jgi:hypothetical protein